MTKKIITLMLLITLTLSLVGCSNTPKVEEVREETTTDTLVENTTESKNVEAVEEATKVEEVKAREPIDIAETAAWLDTLPREERYAWYEERYGKYFTDYVKYKEDYVAAGYVSFDLDMTVDTYVGMPCELFELLNAMTVDDCMTNKVSYKETKTSCIVDW